MPTDYDSPYKEALDHYFQAFLALLFPHIHRMIDWSRGYFPLDTEFQQIVPAAELGRRYVDKLIKVWTLDGEECWVLIHVEIQTTRDGEFPKRMYVYNYRIHDRYNRPVASLAVLADDEPNWRPSEYRSSLFGCEAGVRFPTVKLLDFEDREVELEASPNPFAKVVLADLKSRQTRNNSADRHAWKLRLVRGLYGHGFSAEDIRKLFRLIDRLMKLPPALEATFEHEMDQIQKGRRMPFTTSIVRVGIRNALRKGIETALRIRFGEPGLLLMPEVQAIHEEAQLEAILIAVETAANPDEVRGVWATGAS